MRLFGVALMALAVTVLTPVHAAGPTGNSAEPSSGSARPWLKQSGTPQATATPSRGRSWGTIAAGVVLAALVVGALYRRRQLRRLVAEKRLSRIQILDTTRLGAKAQLVTALVGDRVVVLGVTESQISALTWLEPGEISELEASSPAVKVEQGGLARGGVARKYASTGGTRDETAGARFRGILRQAVSAGPDRESAEDSAALRLANRTRDVVDCSSEATRRARGGELPRAVDVEGQAAGLIARLSKGQR